MVVLASSSLKCVFNVHTLTQHTNLADSRQIVKLTSLARDLLPFRLVNFKALLRGKSIQLGWGRISAVIFE